MATPPPTGPLGDAAFAAVDIGGWHAVWAAAVPVAAAAWKATGSVVEGLFRRWEAARENQIADRDATIAMLRRRVEAREAEIVCLRDRLEQLAREHNPLLVRMLELIEHAEGPTRKDRDAAPGADR